MWCSISPSAGEYVLKQRRFLAWWLVSYRWFCELRRNQRWQIFVVMLMSGCEKLCNISDFPCKPWNVRPSAAKTRPRSG